MENTNVKKAYSDLVAEAVERLENDDELFVDIVNELDSWNGFADGFRGFPMYEIDDFFCDMKVSDFLDKLADGFNHNDAYFVDTIWGIDSTDDLAAYYRGNVSAGEVFDEIIDKYYHIDIYDDDFKNLIDDIINYPDDDSDEDDGSEEDASDDN